MKNVIILGASGSLAKEVIEKLKIELLRRRGVKISVDIFYLECLSCDYSCPEEDFDGDNLFCPECGSHISKSFA